jgi:hypothetical protein
MGSVDWVYEAMFGYMKQQYYNKGKYSVAPYYGRLPRFTYMHLRAEAEKIGFDLCVERCDKELATYTKLEMSLREAALILDDCPTFPDDQEVMVEYIAEKIFRRPAKFWDWQFFLERRPTFHDAVRKRIDEKRDPSMVDKDEPEEKSKDEQREGSKVETKDVPYRPKMTEA